MVWIAAGLFAAVLAAPHFLRHGALAPAWGVALWGAVLVLRATVALAIVFFLVAYLPTTAVFHAVSEWCLHAVLPLAADHLSLSGHQLWDAAVLIPALLMALSLFGAGIGIWRGTRAASRWVQARSLGPGPRESIVVDDPEILLAAAGMRSPRAVISTGALAALDPDELRAGLEHERGHIARRHRLAFVVGRLLCAIARWLPATGKAFACFSLHLERDADDYAIRRTGDPLALASAIGKAALAPDPGAALALGGGTTSERMRLLLAGPAAASRRAMFAAVLLTAALALISIVLLAALPELVVGSGSAGAANSFQEVCPD